ncbi:MAG TPA: ABC transporter substrate binding protein, partial [Prolixibacteraceae bacterium]|nr:ABC transporter substrate binding protein [Prolixibacteraceae bacterium]
FTQKGIDLVKQYLPTIQTVGVLFCPGEMASLSGLRDLEASCRDEGLELISLPVNAVGEVIDATTALCMKKVDAICQLPDNMTIPGFMGMVKTTRKHQVPLFCFITSQVQMGAVAAIAGDFFQQGIEIADMALDVLGGTPPADIPFRRIRQIQTVINPEAARAYGLETPQSLLDSVGVIIQ